MKPVPSERSPLSQVPERRPPRLSARQQGPGNSPQTPEQPGKLQKTGVGGETELAFRQGQLAVLKRVVGHGDAQGPAGEEGPGQPPSGQQGGCPREGVAEEQRRTRRPRVPAPLARSPGSALGAETHATARPADSDVLLPALGPVGAAPWSGLSPERVHF